MVEYRLRAQRNNMDWWIWIVLGLMLVLGELVTPGGFYILFFGIAAIVVGILAGFNVAGPPWFQVIVFSVLSVLTLWLFRERLLQSTHPDILDQVDTLVGETAVITEEIPSRGIGKAEMRGASWSARNIGEKSLARGERCKVERVEGLTIYVRTEQN
jgi:membrane protein implicated in regulation of membrane protease activity